MLLRIPRKRSWKGTMKTRGPGDSEHLGAALLLQTLPERLTAKAQLHALFVSALPNALSSISLTG